MVTCLTWKSKKPGHLQLGGSGSVHNHPSSEVDPEPWPHPECWFQPDETLKRRPARSCWDFRAMETVVTVGAVLGHWVCRNLLHIIDGWYRVLLSLWSTGWWGSPFTPSYRGVFSLIPALWTRPPPLCQESQLLGHRLQWLWAIPLGNQSDKHQVWTVWCI